MGTSENDSVQCHTDLKLCCSNKQGPYRGDWYFPDGKRLHCLVRCCMSAVDLRELTYVELVVMDQLVSIAVIFQLKLSIISPTPQ